MFDISPDAVLPVVRAQTRHAINRPSTSRVAVLMCTYNGQEYLAEQLQSLESQGHRNWLMAVSDDGSSDDTMAILKDYQERWGGNKLLLLNGPRQGYAKNFMSLTCANVFEADFFAWADQDDIWCNNKLASALEWLESVPADVPALYCSRTELVSEDGSSLGYSPLFDRSPSFANALVQNIGGGNTMVFNRAARELLRQAAVHCDVVSHDWMAYLLVTGAGGNVYYDSNPLVLYRQHDSNCLGSNNTMADRLVRMRYVIAGRFKGWNEKNITALDTLKSHLNGHSRQTLEHFKTARVQPLVRRLIELKRCGIYRQTLFGNFGLIVAALLKRV